MISSYFLTVLPNFSLNRFLNWLITSTPLKKRAFSTPANTSYPSSMTKPTSTSRWLNPIKSRITSWFSTGTSQRNMENTSLSNTTYSPRSFLLNWRTIIRNGWLLQDWIHWLMSYWRFLARRMDSLLNHLSLWSWTTIRIRHSSILRRR